MTFRPKNSLSVLEQGRVDENLREGVKSLGDVTKAVMRGFVLHPTASNEGRRLVAKAICIAGMAYTPSTNANYGRAWNHLTSFQTLA